MIDARQLRELGPDGLTGLLARRADVLAPAPPQSLSDLADRLTSPPSVVTALRTLDLPTLQVAEAMAALGQRTDRAALDQLLGRAGDDPAPVDRALAALAEHALLLETGPGLALVPAARAAWPRPLSLGPPVGAGLDQLYTLDELRVIAGHLGSPAAKGRKAEVIEALVSLFRDPDRVRDLVARQPADTRDLLRALAATGESIEDYSYFHIRYDKPRTPTHWAQVLGLIVRGFGRTDLSMPAEVALAIRGPDYHAPFDPVIPEVVRVAVDPAMVARHAAAAGSSFVRLAAALLEEASRTPLTALRAGGIGTRELRRLTKRLGCPEAEVRLALTVVHGAGLLSVTADKVAPTSEYDDWLRQEPAVRLTHLLAAWWRSRYPSMALDEAWNPALGAPAVGAVRALMLREIGEPPDMSIVDQSAFINALAWRRPFAFGDPEGIRVLAPSCWEESTVLGVVASGYLSSAGRALLDGEPDLVTAVGDIGAAQRTVRLQADLTAIVTGTPAAELADLLDTVADSETRGTASTWRFTPVSVRRALDAGHTPQSLLARLSAAAVGALPQPLEYLIADVARRHGALRASAAACCLRGDDTALLAEIAADRKLRGLGLRQLAPTVLASDKPLPETLAALRAAGYAPMAESADGTPVIERVTSHRIPTQAGGGAIKRLNDRPVADTAPRAAPDPAAVAQALLAGPDESADRSPTLRTVLAGAKRLTAAESRLLARAIDEELPVSIDYVSAKGNVARYELDELNLIGTSLVAWCYEADDERGFPLGRITGVQPSVEA